MWSYGGVCVVLSLGCAVGCGGRYEQNAPTSDNADHATNSTPSSGGASTSPNAGTSPNASGGGTAAGGSTIAGSAGTTQVACAHQYSGYVDYQAQVMAEFSSFGCKADDDCRSFYLQSPCDPSCVLLTSAAHRGIVDRLNIFASSNCTPDCWPQPWPTCPTADPVHCVSGRCQ